MNYAHMELDSMSMVQNIPPHENGLEWNIMRKNKIVYIAFSVFVNE